MSYSIPFTSSSTQLKRGRPLDPPSQLPPLPKVNSDLILEVYTHISLRRWAGQPEEYGDNERLIHLGQLALDATVTCALFHKRPLLTTAEIISEREEALSDANLDRWVTMYGMRRKLRCHPDMLPSLHKPKETRSLFHAYLGGVYVEHGIETVQEWISHLLLGEEGSIAGAGASLQPIQPPPSKKAKSGQLSTPIFFASQPPPSPPRQRQEPPHMAFPNPLAPAQPSLPFLPLFNQTATQRRVTVEYPAEFSGPPHAGRWSVRCVVNGIQKGIGAGSSKQIAKEEAARQAYYAMGWT